MSDFRGIYVALVTPFTTDGSVNREKIRDLVALHLEKGTRGIVVCGTTGESACLSTREEVMVIETVVESAAGKLKVFAGAGARSTADTLAKVEQVAALGVDGALVVTPFYNRPGQEGLYQHFTAVANTCKLPIMVYNVPSRTGVDLQPETMNRLAENPHIVALKEAQPNIDRLSELVSLCGDRVALFTGHDPNLYPALCVGAMGVVSVAANFVPADMVRLLSATEEGDHETARKIHLKLFGLCTALALDTNPVPVKEAMNLLGWNVGGLRMPLVPLSDAKREALKVGLDLYGFTGLS